MLRVYRQEKRSRRDSGRRQKRKPQKQAELELQAWKHMQEPAWPTRHKTRQPARLIQALQGRPSFKA